MLTKCISCKFNVRNDDNVCLNCGYRYPSKPNITKSFSPKFFFLSAGIIFTVLYLAFVYYSFLIQANLLAIGAIISLFIALSFGWVLSLFKQEIKIDEEIKYRTSQNKDSLNEMSKIIKDRTDELSKRLQEINSVIDKIKQTDSNNLQKVRGKLLSAKEIVASQLARYDLQKQKIELVRIQNNLLPLFFTIDKMNDFESENSIVIIEQSKAEIAAIHNNILEKNTEFPLDSGLEKDNFLLQLRESASSFQNLRETILANQARRALAEVQPLEEILHSPNQKELTTASEVFNLQISLSDFKHSFDELESEYKRIKSEEETNQQLLNE